MNVSLEVPKEIYNDLCTLAKENIRSIEQEALYRMCQGITLKIKISENDQGLFSVISKLYGRTGDYEQ